MSFRSLLLSCILAVASTLAVTSSAAQIEFIAFGDAPYFMPEAGSMFDKLIAQVNQAQPDFAVHVGDIRGGDTADCSDSTYTRVLAQFNKLTVPLAYTPGDNEWTDCHKNSTGPTDPIERLSSVRRTFFATPFTLGGGIPIRQSLQSDDQGFAKFTENRMWRLADILFVSLHVVGSNNNNQPEIAGAVAEFQERNAANIAWLKKAFAYAKANNIKVISFFWQANTNFEGKPEERTGFNDFIDALRTEVMAYDGQVLAVQGDYHSLLFDQPLKSLNKWGMDWPLSNFTRLQVYGAPDVRGVKVRIDSAAEQPFTVTPMPNIPWEYAVELIGKDSAGKECSLVIDKMWFEPNQGDPEAWYNMHMNVRTNFQIPGNPAIEVKQSPTKWTLYGASKGNYDTIAVTLSSELGKPTEQSIINYSFQTWDEKRGLLQTYCRFK